MNPELIPIDVSQVQPVVWYENQDPGLIAELKATDYDEEKNGAPFTMKLGDSAEPAVRSSFQIEGSSTAGWNLKALRVFDREQRKSYAIPIVVTDNGVPKQSATSVLNVVIGDRNDNPMSNGTSSILVYNYKDSLGDTVIGRVYVQDADDWDLADKTFSFLEEEPSGFLVAPLGGFITVKAHTQVSFKPILIRDWRRNPIQLNGSRQYPVNIQSSIIHLATMDDPFLASLSNVNPLLLWKQDGVYPLKFLVQDHFRKETAMAVVVVTLKSIPEEAVRLSGSLRLSGISQEGFIEPPLDGTSLSPK